MNHKHIHIWISFNFMGSRISITVYCLRKHESLKLVSLGINCEMVGSACFTLFMYLARLQMDAKSLECVTSLNLEAHKQEYTPIPMTEKVHNGFRAAVDALVFDVLMKPLRDSFIGKSL